MKLIEMDLDTLIKQTRKAEANPGGGAILILMSNLATNLILMMDMDDWGSLENKANVSRETLLKHSETLKELMQDDVENFNQLLDKLKEKKASQDDYILAAKALLSMVEANTESLQVLSFYLENGKKSTITDGQIANNLLREAIYASIPTIDINIKYTDEVIDYKKIKNKVDSLYENNKAIIERRIKWQLFMLF